MHSVELERALTLPAVQSWQADIPETLENDPGMHGTQDADPLTFWYCPGLHCEHDEEFELSLIVPATQS